MSRNEVALAERKRMQKVYDATMKGLEPRWWASIRYHTVFNLLSNAYASLAHRYGEVRALERENRILTETLGRMLADESAGRSKVRQALLRRDGRWVPADAMPLGVVSVIKRREPSRWASFGNDGFVWVPDDSEAVA